MCSSGPHELETGRRTKSYFVAMNVMMGVAAVLLAVLLTSCGGSDSDQGSKDDASSTTWSKARSEKEIRAIFANFEAGNQPLVALLRDESKDVPAYNEACQGLAEALSENADKAATGKWPANVKDEMGAFEVALNEEREGVLDCQNAKTYKDVEAGIARWRENSADEQGMELYDLLGGFE